MRQADGGLAPLDESLCFSTVGMTTAGPVMDDIVAALRRSAFRSSRITRSSATAANVYADVGLAIAHLAAEFRTMLRQLLSLAPSAMAAHVPAQASVE